jgi:dCTP diphosphatase
VLFIFSVIAYCGRMDVIKEKLKKFVQDRDWDQYHNPKNLVLSLISETGELAEIFRWLSAEECESVMQNHELAKHIREEVADIFNNLMLLSMKLDIDLLDVAKKKLTLTEEKYPTAIWKGRARQV